MSKPVSIPNSFQAQAGPIPLSQLDANFSALSGAVNDFGTYGNFLVDSGSANTMVVTTPVSTTFAYSAGVPVQVQISTTNTSTAVTLAVNALGAKSVLNNDGSNPAIGQLVAGMILSMQYNGTNFLLTGAASKPGSIAPFVATSAGNVTLPAPTSGGFTYTVGTAAGGSPQLWTDGTVNGGVSFSGGVFSIGSLTNNNTVLLSNGISRWIISGATGGISAVGVTGGDKGTGTINATGLFVNGASVSGSFGTYLSAPATSTSTVTFATAMSLTLPVGTFKLSALLSFSEVTSGAGGIRFQVIGGTATVSFTNLFGAENGIVAATAVNAYTASGGPISFAAISTATNADFIKWDMTITVSIAGTVLLQFAQNSPSGNTTTLAQGSSLTATQVG